MGAPPVCSGTGSYRSDPRNNFDMITSSTPFRHGQRCYTAVLLFVASTALFTGGHAGELDDRSAAVIDTPKAVSNGELVFHGNYCGLGNRARAAPVDALDRACMHHDACTPSGKIPSCACNARLVEEAGAVARDPAQPAELQLLASLTATAAAAGFALCATAAHRSPLPETKVSPGTIQPADRSTSVAEEKPNASQALPVAPVPPHAAPPCAESAVRA